MIQTLQIHPADNVAVALSDLRAGETVASDRFSCVLREAVPAGHKFALRPIRKGEPVVKYGLPIGEASAPIAEGEHVHTHNLHTLLSGELSYAYAPVHPALAPVAPRTFDGYMRSDGRAGVRNELWILPTVGCVNDIATELEKRAQALVGGTVENVRAFPHPYGCSQMSEDQENTRQILADLAVHPNAGGVLVLGLGCENSGVAEIRKRMGAYDESRVRFLVAQDVKNELDAGMALLSELAQRMRGDRREPLPASKLIVGLKCGGSDGFSGLTANPLIGRFSDRLVAMGGATILTEVPEMFGAETLLMARCENEAVFADTVDMINDFKRYYEDNHQTIYENPLPRQQGRRHFHAGGQGAGLHAKKRQRAGDVGAALRGPCDPARAHPAQRSWQRPGLHHGAFGGGRADRAVFHRPGHAVRRACANLENRQ